MISQDLEDTYALFELGLENWDKKSLGVTRQVKIFFLDNQSNLLGTSNCSAQEESQPENALAAAHMLGACNFVLMENHLDASDNILLKDNISTTQRDMLERFKEAGHVMHVPLKDYLLISEYGYYSAKEHELAP